MFPHSSTFSSASTGIKTEDEEFQEAVEVKVKEEPEEENEKNPQESLSQFVKERRIRKSMSLILNEPQEDEWTNETDFEPEEVELKCNLKEEEWLTENEQDSITNTNEVITTETQTETTSPIQIPIPTPTQKQICPFCNKQFLTLRRLKFHMRYHDVKRHKCTLCDYATSDLSNFKYHQLVHTGQKPWKCSEPNCQMAFNKKHTLENHEFSIHGRNEGNLKLFRCERCPFKAIREYQLKLHAKGTHSNIKRFSCPRCERKFARRGALKRHIQCVHMKLRPFKCPQSGCEYSAKDGGNFRRHQRVKHNKNPEQSKAIWKNLSPSHSAVQIANKESQPEVPIKNSQSHTENVHQQQKSSKPAVKGFTLFYHCDHCDFFTKQDKQLAIHLYSQHNLPRVILKELRPLKDGEREMTEAETCSTQTRKEKQMEMPQSLLKCSEPGCENAFSSRWNLNCHEFSVHGKRGDLPIFTCSFCSYETPRRFKLRHHIDSRHK